MKAFDLSTCHKCLVSPVALDPMEPASVWQGSAASTAIHGDALPIHAMNSWEVSGSPSI
jgi:hypothetical protein